MTSPNILYKYLTQVGKPHKKLTKLEFLQPDNSVAFILDGNYKAGYNTRYDTRAFIQTGGLNVSLQNGQRRNADVTFANVDGAFEYNVNKLWFGQRAKLSMGIELDDGTPFYLPQGVFYIDRPNSAFSSNSRTTSIQLVDKWAYLDGLLFGDLPVTHIIPEGANIFNAIIAMLNFSRYNLQFTSDISSRIDNVSPIFTDFYYGKTYTTSGGGTIPMTQVPYDINANGTIADAILQLTELLAGWVGYNATGNLCLDPSQNDIDDSDKPSLWTFSQNNPSLFSFTESPQNGAVYNEVLVVGEGLTGGEVFGKATNLDAGSDTNVNIIGLRPFRQEQADYWTSEQCIGLARMLLKQKTVLQKSVSIQCLQLFHLYENGVISLQRTDKSGSPVEKHLIQSYSLPLDTTSPMTINCTSVNDIPTFTTSTTI